MNFRKVVALLTLLAFFNTLIGCTSTHTFLKDELFGSGPKVTAVILTGEQRVEFDPAGGRFNGTTGLISGKAADNRQISVSLSEVTMIYVEEESGGETIIRGYDPVVFQHKVAKEPIHQVAAVVTNDGREIQFGGTGGNINLTGKTVSGFSRAGQPVLVNFDEILYVKIKKSDPVKSALATLGVVVLVAAALIAIAMATKESCPFIYSFDGSHYIFDGEPLGGAICPAMQRYDYSRLDFLRPIGGEYRLLVQNEVAETQYLDDMNLLVFDHPDSLEVVADSVGNFYYVQKPVPAARAVDETGRDLRPFVQARDVIAWQSRMPMDSSGEVTTRRHELTFTFPKPVKAKAALLVANIGTTLWGSGMIKEMLDLRGTQVDSWYQWRGTDSGRAQSRQFNEREEIWILGLDIKEGDSWVRQAYFHGMGPFMIEDRILPLDLSGVTGDSVTIRVQPPFGFWVVDYLALEYNEFEIPQYTRIPLKIASDHLGRDVTPLLLSHDGQYHIMPSTGDAVKLAFDAPSMAPQSARTVFLECCGYYDIHLPKEKAPQAELLAEIMRTPGAAVQYALERYMVWSDSLLALQQGAQK